MADNKILEAALEYAAKGWAVFPVNKFKQPLTPNGCLDATTDVDTIVKMFGTRKCNVAIATGSKSGGLVIIDLDVDKDKDIDGVEVFNSYCDDNDLFIETLTVITGRQGKHLYIQSPESFGVAVGKPDGLFPGIDIRGEGGYVVAPPSIHENGREYFFDDEDEEIINTQTDPDVEYFLHEYFDKIDKKPVSQIHSSNNTFININELPVLTKGTRNDTLFKYLCALQADGLSDDEIEERAYATNNASDCPLSDRELKTIIKSVIKRYEKNTRQKEEKSNVKTEIKPKKKRLLKTAESLLQKNLPEPKVLIGVNNELPILVEGTCVLSAKPKVGKSWLALAMCVAVANGDDFLGYKTCKCSTLYLDLETSEQLQQKRLKKVLNGADVPHNFYLETETDNLDSGFIEQIESYLEQDPNIGLIVVDVFQIIRSEVDAKSKENEYSHVYRDLTPLNNLAQKHHLAIVLVCHDRKMVDPEDPFSNILGSTGLQGAATQMIVMFKRRKDDPIHISVKGKTIDGLPDLDVKLDKGQWQLVSAIDPAERQKQEAEEEYNNSIIRKAVLKIAEIGEWQGRCSSISNEAVNIGMPFTESPQSVGYFINKHQGRFLKNDGVKVQIISNGTGGKIYKISTSTVDAVDRYDTGYWQSAVNTEVF